MATALPKVAILGGTGLVGQTILSLLLKRNFPCESIKLLASQRSAGKEVEVAGKKFVIEEVTEQAFEGIDLVLASAGGSVSEQWVPIAVKKGCTVVDNTSFYRMHPDVPLVVAGVNDEDCKKHTGIIANPNCSTAQLMPVLKDLQEAFGLKRVIISTYQSASGGGQKGIAELERQMQSALDQNEPVTDSIFNRDLGLNVVPHIDKFLDNGYTKEEMKMIEETQKILHLPNLAINATAVRVPVRVGHSESITVDLMSPADIPTVVALWEKNPLLRVFKEASQYPTPVEAAGEEPVYVGRIRKDTSNPDSGLCFWVVADNLLIGAALNAVRIAEYLQKNSLITSLSQNPITV